MGFPRVHAVLPPWMLILLLMILLMLVINPSREQYDWMMRLTRPPWLVGFQVWLPVLWLIIYIFLYVSALTSWRTLGSWPWMVTYGLLLVLIKANTLLMCKARRLAYGAGAGLISWTFGLVMAGTLSRASPNSMLGLLPFLLWAPVETWATWRMRKINP